MPQTTNVSLPKGLVHGDFERDLPPKSKQSPIRFVPELTAKSTGQLAKHESVKITVSPTVQKTFPLFGGGSMEEACILVRRHEGLLLDMNLAKDYKVLKALHKEKKKELDALPPEETSPRTTLAEEIREIAAQMLDIDKRPFELLEKLVGEGLREQVRDIVEKECDKPGAISLRGAQLALPRGRNLKAVKVIYIRFTGLFGPEDAYELVRRYL